MKKIICTLLSALVIVGALILGGCTTSTPIETTTPTQTTTTQSPTTTPSPTTTTTTPSSTTTTTPSPTTTTVTPSPTSVTIDLVAQNIAFDLSTITVPAGASVTINFDNKDSVPHNFAVYTDSSAKTEIFRGQVISGPATTVYQFTAPTTPGTYFFRCDVHPAVMTGSFIVQ